MHIVIDFDGVIRDPTTNDPIEGSVKGLVKLKKDGHKITILTANDVRFVQSWIIEKVEKVVRLGIIDRVTNMKPVADMYIDDKGIKFIDWGSLLNEIPRDNSTK